MTALPRRTIEIVGGLKVVVPDSLELVTPYVLIEQQDWFEDEIRFVRRAVEPGQRAIDIGANYGLFALSLAQAVGPGGRVWAFEPTTSTADHLAASIEANGFGNLLIDRRGVSSGPGTAELSLNANSELNGIVRGAPGPGARERIALASLDGMASEFGWEDVAFLKIDAEGEESRIIEGARRFLSEHSPLVQFEVKAAKVFRLDLVRMFEGLGYSCYRLAPGPGILVPFDARDPVDPFLLNLFCCKPDRAERLSGRGLLARPSDSAPTSDADLMARWNADGSLDWQVSMRSLPYVQALSPMWDRARPARQRGQVERALAMFALSRLGNASPAERFASLKRSFELLSKACADASGFARLSSLARVARDLGARSVAVRSLASIIDGSGARGGLEVTEPFLVPCDRFEAIPPGVHPGNWAIAAALEELERLSFYSSFYAGPAARPRLELIQSLGFAGLEMGRRLQLVQSRRPHA